MTGDGLASYCRSESQLWAQNCHSLQAAATTELRTSLTFTIQASMGVISSHSPKDFRPAGAETPYSLTT